MRMLALLPMARCSIELRAADFHPKASRNGRALPRASKGLEDTAK
jgi:hypothetical protein